MTLTEDPEFTASYPSEYNCRITLTGRDGQKHTAHAFWPNGHRSNPMNDTEVEDKFRSFAGVSLPSEQQERVLEVLWDLDKAPLLEPLYDSLTIPA